MKISKSEQPANQSQDQSEKSVKTEKSGKSETSENQFQKLIETYFLNVAE